jgi:hypothetical protein
MSAPLFSMCTGMTATTIDLLISTFKNIPKGFCPWREQNAREQPQIMAYECHPLG